MRRCLSLLLLYCCSFANNLCLLPAYNCCSFANNLCLLPICKCFLGKLHSCYNTKEVLTFIEESLARRQDIWHFALWGQKKQGQIWCSWKQFLKASFLWWRSCDWGGLGWQHNPSLYLWICQFQWSVQTLWERGVIKIFNVMHIYYIV